MRIGYLTYGLDRAPAGIGRYAVELLRSLVALRSGHEIVLLSTEREDRHGLWDLVERHALPACRMLPLLMTGGNMVLSLAARRYGLDVCHDPNGIAPFLGPGMMARQIVTIHDAFTYVQPRSHNRLDNWRYRYQLPYAARRADMVITVSECSRRDLIRSLGLLAERVQVIAEGVDSRFKPVADSAERQAVLARYGIRPPYILYVGGINARKNIARLLDAYARMRAYCPEVTLVLGGKRQWRTGEIDTAFRRLGLADSIHFTGYVDDCDLPAIYSAAELFVFPSLYEGFGLPPLEAMACGTPVVTSNSSSLPEVVGDAALTVSPYDVNALSAAIVRVLKEPALHSDLRQRGIKRVAQFTWDRVARETLAAYEKALMRMLTPQPDASEMRKD